MSTTSDPISSKRCGCGCGTLIGVLETQVEAAIAEGKLTAEELSAATWYLRAHFDLQAHRSGLAIVIDPVGIRPGEAVRPEGERFKANAPTEVIKPLEPGRVEGGPLLADAVDSVVENFGVVAEALRDLVAQVELAFPEVGDSWIRNTKAVEVARALLSDVDIEAGKVAIAFGQIPDRRVAELLGGMLLRAGLTGKAAREAFEGVNRARVVECSQIESGRYKLDLRIDSVEAADGDNVRLAVEFMFEDLADRLAGDEARRNIEVPPPAVLVSSGPISPESYADHVPTPLSLDQIEAAVRRIARDEGLAYFTGKAPEGFGPPTVIESTVENFDAAKYGAALLRDAERARDSLVDLGHTFADVGKGTVRAFLDGLKGKR